MSAKYGVVTDLNVAMEIIAMLVLQAGGSATISQQDHQAITYRALNQKRHENGNIEFILETPKMDD